MRAAKCELGAFVTVYRGVTFTGPVNFETITPAKANMQIRH